MIDVMQQFTNVEWRFNRLERRHVRTRMGSPTWPPRASKATNAGTRVVRKSIEFVSMSHREPGIYGWIKLKELWADLQIFMSSLQDG
jgi:hypothetical protein